MVIIYAPDERVAYWIVDPATLYPCDIVTCNLQLVTFQI